MLQDYTAYDNPLRKVWEQIRDEFKRIDEFTGYDNIYSTDTNLRKRMDILETLIDIHDKRIDKIIEIMTRIEDILKTRDYFGIIEATQENAPTLENAGAEVKEQ